MRIEYYSNGLIDCIRYTDRYVKFDYQLSDNNLDHIFWRISYYKYNAGNTNYHNENGPAYIKYDKYGNIECEYYYIHGKKASNKDIILCQLNTLLEKYDYYIKFVPNYGDSYYFICNLVTENIITKSSFDNLEQTINELI